MSKTRHSVYESRPALIKHEPRVEAQVTITVETSVLESHQTEDQRELVTTTTRVTGRFPLDGEAFHRRPPGLFVEESLPLSPFRCFLIA
jgi:hypothetical protein